MKKSLRILLFCHVTYFLIWGLYLLTSHGTGKDIWLETTPVDPRDLISGHYVALDFPIQRIPTKLCDFGHRALSETVYVQLEESPTQKQTPSGPVQLWIAKSCQKDYPKDSSQIWIKGQIKNIETHQTTLMYGIEKYFVSETSPLRTARSGQVVAKVRIGRNLQLRLLDLVYISR